MKKIAIFLIIASLVSIFIRCQSKSIKVENTGPNSPSNLMGWARSPSMIQLGWQDNSAVEDSFVIYRMSPGFGFRAIGSAPMNTIFYVDSMLFEGNAYSYYVRSANENGLSEPSNTVSVTTLINWSAPSNPTPPDSTISPGYMPPIMTLEWECNDVIEDSLKYDIYFGAQSPPPLVRSSYSYHVFTFDSLSFLQNYYWKIVAYDWHNNHRESPIWTFRILRPVMEIGDIDVPAWRSAIESSYLFAAARDSLLRIVDISNPREPFLANSVLMPGTMQSIEVNNNLAYIASGGAGLQIINVNDVNNPFIIGSYPCSSAVYIDVEDGRAYLAIVGHDPSYSLKILDINNPQSPILLGSGDLGFDPSEISANGNYVYMTSFESGIQIIDVTNLANLEIIGQINTYVAPWVSAIGNRLYYSRGYSLEIADIQNPYTPQHIASIETDILVGSIDIVGDYAYIAGLIGGLEVINISDPLNPETIAIDERGGDARDISVQGDYVYVSKYYFPGGGLAIFRLIPQ